MQAAARGREAAGFDLDRELLSRSGSIERAGEEARRWGARAKRRDAGSGASQGPIWVLAALTGGGSEAGTCGARGMKGSCGWLRWRPRSGWKDVATAAPSGGGGMGRR